ncbi:hypothetical protein GDO81_025208 [Engystomops pustulosus]|uniref:Uncharacterized protein n=1 Tax=Engystomops pustulosus TaxID=76066 RepID=A0AAV6ZHH3_ENGPU|nr:hypothetical protein GDO81_025208 [Engystomops pustulosus]
MSCIQGGGRSLTILEWAELYSTGALLLLLSSAVIHRDAEDVLSTERQSRAVTLRSCYIFTSRYSGALCLAVQIMAEITQVWY